MLRPFPPPTASTWGFVVPEFCYTRPSLASWEEQLIPPGLSFWTLAQNDSNTSIYKALTQILVSCGLSARSVSPETHILNFDVTVPASLDNICAAFLTGCLPSSDAKIKTNSIRKSKWWWWWSTFLLYWEQKGSSGVRAMRGWWTDRQYMILLPGHFLWSMYKTWDHSLREAVVS